MREGEQCRTVVHTAVRYSLLANLVRQMPKSFLGLAKICLKLCKTTIGEYVGSILSRDNYSYYIIQKKGLCTKFAVIVAVICPLIVTILKTLLLMCEDNKRAPAIPINE